MTLCLVCPAGAALPTRIVSLAPHATELLFAAGAGERVVAVSESCDYPERVRKLPKVSGFRGTNVEAVVALDPDWVVAWPSGNRQSDIDALRRLGIRVVASELTTLAAITAELRRFTAWSGSDQQRRDALREADAADTLRLRLQQRYRDARRVRVFYQLGGGRLFTLSDRHVVGEALALCGADNVFGQLALPAPEVATEAVLAARPDAVLLAEGASIDAVRAQWRAAGLYASADLANARVIAVDGTRLHRPTLRTFAAVHELCESIDRIRLTLPK